jgi:hypothetical protein
MAGSCSYYIDSMLAAIELREPQEGLRMGTIARIPPGSSVELSSHSSYSSSSSSSDGMVEITWKGRKYAVFLEDLQERGELAETEPEDASE